MQKTTPNHRLPSVGSSQAAASPVGIALQLCLSQLLAGCVTLSASFWMIQLHVQQPYSLLIALAAGCIAGLLAMVNFQYHLYLLELALAYLAHGLPVARKDEGNTRHSFAHRWPLGSLFLHVQDVEKRFEYYIRNESLTSDFRVKALQQASEAAAQAERNRIARELHDSIKQQIFSISVSAAAAKAHWQGEDSGDARVAVEDIQRSAREAQVEMQALLQQLRPAPLENTSLAEALRVQAQALGFRTGAQMYVDIGEMPGNDGLLPGTQEAIFRLVQEVFANIAKHARAHTVWFALHTSEQALSIEVRDDGQGFAPANVQKGMGLNNLHERAQELHGRIEIKSQPGQGTRVAITLPLLEALRSPEEEARQRYELARANELAGRGYQLCENLSYVGFGILALTARLNLHWSVFVFCLLVAFYGYVSGLYYRLQVTQNAGQMSRFALELRRQHYHCGLNLVCVAGVGVWFFFNRVELLVASAGWWLVAVILASLIGFLLFARRQYHLDTEHYYSLLSTQELHWELNRRKQVLTRNLIFWCICCGFGLIFAHTLFVLPPVTPVERTAYGIAVILLLMGIGLLIAQVQLQRWRQILSRRKQDTSAQEVYRG